MDKDVARWILEFVLRQRSISEKLLDDLLSILPVQTTDYRLTKTTLLRQMEAECSRKIVSEKILDILEHIEEIDYRYGNRPCSKLMQAAYCAVAVDCTVVFLEENGENHGSKYLEKVHSIWRERVSELDNSENCLVSEELLDWRDRVETAVWDSDTCRRILERNTRFEALKAVSLYVREAWADLGPTFLEQAAEAMKRMGQEEWDSRGSGTIQVAGEEVTQVVEEEVAQVEMVTQVAEQEKVGNIANTSLEFVVHDHNAVVGDVIDGGIEAERGGTGHGGGESSMMSKPAVGGRLETQKKQTPLRCKKVARGRRAGIGRSEGAKIADTDEVQEEQTQLSQCHEGPFPEVHRVQEGPRSNSTKLSEVVYDTILEATEFVSEAEKVDGGHDVAIQNKRGRIYASITAAIESNDECAVTTDKHVDAAAVHQENAGAKGVSKDSDHVAILKKNGGRVNETSAPFEYNDEYAVQDVAAATAHRKKACPGEAGVFVNSDHVEGGSSAAPIKDIDEHAVQNATAHDFDAPAKDTNLQENASSADKDGGNVGDLLTREKNKGKRKAASTYMFELDDSIEESPSPSSSQLPPSPKKRKMSPLKKSELLKITKRRQNRRWTNDEEDALRSGVEKFGVGNWKLINAAYHTRFQDRTDRDLKDKWRNLLKYGR